MDPDQPASDYNALTRRELARLHIHCALLVAYPDMSNEKIIELTDTQTSLFIDEFYPPIGLEDIDDD